MDNNVVKLPGPAISGKTTGTKVEEPDGLSFLKISTPKIISMEIIRITNAPARQMIVDQLEKASISIHLQIEKSVE